MQVIPAVDVLDGAVVRLARGDYGAVTTYGDSPSAQLRSWCAAGAPLVHVVDLTGARTGNHDRALWDELAEANCPFQIGGGVRDAATAAAVVDAGASRVVLGTAAVWEPGVIDDTLDRIGPSRLVAALDVRAGRAQGAGWMDEGQPVGAVAARLAAQGVVRALVTGIERDGMLAGPDLAVLASVSESAPDLALIGSGGVGSLDDLRALVEQGVEAAIVGRALYEERFSYAEAVVAAG